MEGHTLDLSRLTWNGFLINNLIPVTLGNIVGGGFLIVAVFWFIYLRPHISYLSINIKSDSDQEKK